MGKSLFDKVWDQHTVRPLPGGETQLLVGLHLIHEVTSPQAFGMLRDLGLPGDDAGANVRDGRSHHPHRQPQASLSGQPRRGNGEGAQRGLRASSASPSSTSSRGAKGIVHIIGPELGLTQPGITIACGDSHTSTHGAFGAIAFGIGTTQVRDVLATQMPGARPLKVRRIEVDRQARPGRLCQRHHPPRHSHVSACSAAPATPTSTRARPSTRCRWKSG